MNENLKDPLESITVSELVSLSHNKDEDINTTIKKYLTDYVSIVVPPLFKEAGRLDAKYKRALSYPAHIVTAVFTGSILYIYDRMSTGQKPPQAHDIKLLCTALTLHDVNKYWNESTGKSHSGNYYKLIRDYFEADPFDLKSYFPDWTSEIEEIAFLVQHAQESDDAQHETRLSQPKYAKLLPYVKVGDKVASLGKEENPLHEIHRRLKNEGHDVHIMLLPEMPQQLLSQIVYRSAKKLLSIDAVPLLISTQGILYLSPNKIFIDNIKFRGLISDELVRNTNAKPDLTDRKFDLRPLLSIPLSKEDRFSVYVKSVREKTEAGLLSVLGKTTYPQDERLQEAIACITYSIYNDKKGSDWSRFPELEKFIGKKELNDELKKIGKIRANFASQEGIGGQKCKPYAVHELIQNHNMFRDSLELLHNKLREFILSNLDNEASALDSIVNFVCAHNREISNGLIVEKTPKGNKDICFKCGAVAEREYKPGKHFLQSGGYTRRATVNDQYKRECDICQIEHLLIDRLLEKSELKVSDDIIFFYFYFDTVFVNIDPFQDQMSKVEISVKGTKTEKLGLNFRLGDFATPFHIEPLAIRLPKRQPEQSSKSTRRARAIHTAIKACLECGCKCVVTSPYTLMRTYDDIFYNERPKVLEKTMGIDRIRNFKEAKVKDLQLDFINQFDGMKGLYRVQRFQPITVIPYVKREVENFERWVNNKGDYLAELFGDENMNMKEIAEKGVNLFGKHKFTGSYKRVKIFRTALDSLMGAKAQQYPDDEAIKFAAAEVWKDVLREQFSKKKGKDIPTECLDYVNSIVNYLKEHGLWSVKKISQWGNSLADVYEFEYIQISRAKGDEN
ncbi:MAG: hypothetical protein GYA36_23470 [Veillonellaceae bacterium]|nr:hypothetical protein [Veillonellaceae bacterium]